MTITRCIPCVKQVIGCCLAFVPLSGGFTWALAAVACVSGAQCRLDDGSIHTLATTSFHTDTAGQDNAAVVVLGSGLFGDQIGITASTQNDHYGMYLGKGANVALKNTSIQAGTALKVQGEYGPVTNFYLESGSLKASAGHAVELHQHANGAFVDVDVTAHAAPSVFLLRNGAEFQMTGGSITATGTGDGIAMDAGDSTSEVHLTGVTLRSATNGRGIVGHGSSTIDLSRSRIITDGPGGVGLSLSGEAGTEQQITLYEGASLQAPQSLAIQIRGGGNHYYHELRVRDSSVHGDRLIELGACTPPMCSSTATAQAYFDAENSQLYGHASVHDGAWLRMNLTESTWILSPSAEGRVRSEVSVLNLVGTDNGGSHIRFDPQGTGLWQTLVVGPDTVRGDAAYEAGTGAQITLNTYLNSGGTLSQQFTDRVLIHGDTAGESTTVHIIAAPGSPGGLTSPDGTYLASEGISLIQVSGQARETSFVLDGGYVTLNGQPFRYQLQAYGPDSGNGPADTSQRLVGGTDPHWDWRLQSEHISSFPEDPSKPGQPGVRALVPQAASYLVAPNALFQAGLLDVGTLHRRLGHARTTAGAALPANPRGAAFLRTYGGDYDYRSSRSLNPYAYNADVRYAAIQGGGNVYGMDAAQTRWRFGLAGSVGDLSFAPHHVADSRKTKMRVWSLAPTLTWQHTNGSYVDVVAAHGRFAGDVATRTLGKTAKLTGKRAALSIEAGTPLPMATLTVQPQAQVVYQRLAFDATHARDLGSGFPVNLGRLDQWTLRGGAEVRKTFTTKAGGSIQVIGNLHLAHTRGDGESVWLGQDFRLSRMGTTVEAGVAVHAMLAGGRTVVHAEISRQNRASRAGYQGWAGNLGVRIKF